MNGHRRGRALPRFAAVVVGVVIVAGATVLTAVPAVAADLPTIAETQGRLTVVDGDHQIRDIDMDGTSHYYGIIAQDVTWSPDGSKFAYIDLSTSGVWVVNADGSGEHQVVWPDAAAAAAGFAVISYVSWSPDGTRIAFVARQELCGNPDNGLEYGDAVYAVTVQTGAVEQVSVPVIHWEANFTICRDMSRGMAWGPGGRIAVATSDSQMRWSRSVSTFRSPKQDIVVIDVIGHAETDITWDEDSDKHINRNPTWTGDGRVAYTGTDFPSNGDSLGTYIKVRNVDGTGEQRATSRSSEELLAAWSPSGSHIAFYPRTPENPDALDLRVMKADGTGEFTVANVGAFTLTWHPVPPRPTASQLGGRITVVDGDSQIRDIDMDGTSHYYGIIAQDVTWSPDGSKFAYIDLLNSGMWVVNADGSGEHQVVWPDAAAAAAGYASIVSASWSPDGTRIAFIARQERCGNPVNGVSYGHAVYTVNLQTGAVEQVSVPVIHWLAHFTICRHMDRGLAWGPGGLIAVATSDTQMRWSRSVSTYVGPKEDIVLIDVEGHTESNVTWDEDTDGHGNEYPTWTGDGRLAYTGTDFDSNGDSPGTFIKVRNVDGTGEQRATSRSSEELLAAWSPSGSHIAFYPWRPEDPDALDLRVMKADGTGEFTVAHVGAAKLTWHPLPPPPSPDVTITSCDPTSLAGITAITGNLIIDVSCSSLSLPNLTSVGGDILVTGDATLTELTFPALTSVGGNVNVSCNASLTTIDADDLQQVGGDVDVSGNATLTDVSAPTLTVIGGDVDVSGNTTMTDLTFPTLTTIGGDVDVSGEATLTPLDCATGEPGAPVTAPGQDLDVLSMPSLTTVGGDVDVTSGTQLDLATGGGTTSVTMLGGLATMHLDLPDGAFDHSTGFSVTAVPPADLDPADGTSAGDPVSVDPVMGYAFTFDVPTLDKDAALAFDLDLTTLDPGLSAAVKAALSAGTLRLWTKNDAGATQAFPICAAGSSPTAGGCVTVTVDGDHVRFEGVVGHFSSYGIGVVSPLALPVVMTDPTDVSVLDGANATFTSSATGIPTPTVQWESSTNGTTWLPLGGETASTLQHAAAFSDNGRKFRAVWTNRLGSDTSEPATLTVRRLDPPPVADAGGPYTVVEGGSLVLDATHSSADSTAWAWDLDGDTQYDDATGATPTITSAALSLLRDGPLATTVSVRATDAAGQSATATTGLTVTNAAPTASVAPPTGAGAVGAQYSVTLSATDPSTVDSAAGFTYAVTWGDGATSSTGTHTYTAAGTYPISVTATDKDGATSAPVAASVVVSAPTVASAALAPDVCRPTSTSVVVRGTVGADTISIAMSKSLVAVTVNGRLLGSFAPTGRIAVYAGDGNDAITIDPKLSRDVVILAGAGNDTITSDQGTGIYVGGPGNDSVLAGKGRDVVLGGSGLDTLRAGQGDDLLIAGATSYENDLATLCGIATALNRTDLTYAARADVVRGLVGATLGATDDAARDTLEGGQGQDWFAARPGAAAPADAADRASNELLTLLT